MSTIVPAPGGVARVGCVISKLMRTYWYSFGTTLWRLRHVSREAALLRVCRFPANGQAILFARRDPYSPGWHINQWIEAKGFQYARPLQPGRSRKRQEAARCSLSAMLAQQAPPPCGLVERQRAVWAANRGSLMHARRGHGPVGKASLGVSHNDYGTEPKEPWPRGSTAGLSFEAPTQTKPNPGPGPS